MTTSAVIFHDLSYSDLRLYAAANAIAALQSRPLSGIRTVATGDLADAL